MLLAEYVGNNLFSQNFLFLSGPSLFRCLSIGLTHEAEEINKHLEYILPLLFLKKSPSSGKIVTP